jgi:hypothetical protein
MAFITPHETAGGLAGYLSVAGKPTDKTVLMHFCNVILAQIVPAGHGVSEPAADMLR